ncbi:hypothetical protein EDB84DRAFT_1511366, partial [Lactarius hengduanensis]
ACPRVPPSRANEAERGRCRGDGERGRHALAHPPSARMRKGGGWRALACLHPARTHAPFLRVWGVRPKGKGRAGEIGRAAAACPRTHPYVGMGGAAKGEGVGPKAKGRRALVRTPSTRMGWRGQEKGAGKGRGDGVPSCAPPFLVRPLSALERGGGQCGGKGRRGRGRLTPAR